MASVQPCFLGPRRQCFGQEEEMSCGREDNVLGSRRNAPGSTRPCSRAEKAMFWGHEKSWGREDNARESCQASRQDDGMAAHLSDKPE